MKALRHREPVRLEVAAGTNEKLLESIRKPLGLANEEIYEIDPNKCTECVGHFEEPQCQQVCPVSCIPFNPAWRESKEELLAKYERLTAAKAA